MTTLGLFVMPRSTPINSYVNNCVLKLLSILSEYDKQNNIHKGYVRVIFLF